MKKKIVIFSIVGLIVLAGGGASAYFLVLKGGAPADVAAVDGEVAAEVEPEDLPPAMFHNLPTLVVNANYQGRLRYLQVKLSVMTRDEDTLDKIMSNTPLIQDSLIMLLGTYDISELETSEGKETLRQAAQDKIGELIKDNKVESVLFTGFVIQ